MITTSAKEEKDITFETLKLLYSENSNMIREIYRWREKVIVRFLITMGSLCIFGAWLFEYSPKLMYIPFAIGIIISVLSGFMDITIGKKFTKCYELGKFYEEQLKYRGVYTIFSNNYNNPKTILTFTKILSAVYFGTLVFSLIGLLEALINIRYDM